MLKQLKSFIKRKTSLKYRFNLQYQNNKWDGLRNIEDLGRYSIIVGYSKFFFPQARILDLGCGEGVLHERFSPSDYSHYVGVDISEVAIEFAQKKENVKTKFIVGDLDKLTVDGSFDVILFNESVYYLKSPLNSVKALFHNLNPGGIFIVSNFNKHGQENPLGAELTEILDLADSTRITNLKGDQWTIYVYKMKQ